MPPKVLLLPNGVDLLNKRTKLAIQILRFFNCEMVDVIVTRDGVNSVEALFLVPLSQDQVADQLGKPDLDGRKGHARLQSNARLFRQHRDRPAMPGSSEQQVKEPSNGRRFALEMRGQPMSATSVGLVAVGKSPPAPWAAPQRHLSSS